MSVHSRHHASVCRTARESYGAAVVAPAVILPFASLEAHRAALACIASLLLLLLVLLLPRWRAAMRRSTRLAQQLQRAIDTARQRESERDSAQQELIARLKEERDLAQQKTQFESQLTEYEKYAALAQLALGAAHEINNPLLGIQSHLELELREVNNAERREEILQCIEGSKRISSTLRALLNYARPAPLMLSRINLSRLVEDTIAFLVHQPLFRAVKLVNKVPPDLPTITADGTQLSQVLMNLLLNAGQAISGAGVITVSAAEDGFDRIELQVTDTGCGISADILPHVFEPFFTTKRSKGTGLGLSISQSYLRSHGGDIRLESAAGGGTTVRVLLPVRQERTEAEPEEVVM